MTILKSMSMKVSVKQNEQPLKFIDLFAGLGGFHLALENLGCKCVFASELREDLQKLYAINFKGTKIMGDITKIDPKKDIPSHSIKGGYRLLW